MKHPWECINLSDYENHMKLNTVMQLQILNDMMQDQFCSYPASSLMILGIAGGNGLNHIDANRFEMVYGVDINGSFLEECKKRYPELRRIFTPIHADLQNKHCVLPKADLVIANLLIEYIGYTDFQRVIRQVKPSHVSCVIQINGEHGLVSDSPYRNAFDGLNELHNQIGEYDLSNAMKEIEYALIFSETKALPNGKNLVRLDYQKIVEL